jgi:hypothetical protein
VDKERRDRTAQLVLAAFASRGGDLRMPKTIAAPAAIQWANELEENFEMEEKLEEMQR